jgi:hypothetical protein
LYPGPCELPPKTKADVVVGLVLEVDLGELTPPLLGRDLTMGWVKGSSWNRWLVKSWCFPDTTSWSCNRSAAVQYDSSSSLLSYIASLSLYSPGLAGAAQIAGSELFSDVFGDVEGVKITSEEVSAWFIEARGHGRGSIGKDRELLICFAALVASLTTISWRLLMSWDDRPCCEDLVASCDESLAAQIGVVEVECLVRGSVEDAGFGVAENVLLVSFAFSWLIDKLAACDELKLLDFLSFWSKNGEGVCTLEVNPWKGFLDSIEGCRVCLSSWCSLRVAEVAALLTSDSECNSGSDGRDAKYCFWSGIWSCCRFGFNELSPVFETALERWVSCFPDGLIAVGVLDPANGGESMIARGLEAESFLPERWKNGFPIDGTYFSDWVRLDGWLECKNPGCTTCSVFLILAWISSTVIELDGRLTESLKLLSKKRLNEYAAASIFSMFLADFSI